MPDQTEHHRPAPVAVHPFGREFLLVGWSGAATPAAGRLQVSIDGARMKPPFSRITLPLTGSGHRTLLALRCALPPHPVVIDVRGAGGETLAHGEAQAPARAHSCDAQPLLAGLHAGEQARLARFLLEVCSPLFRLSADPAFLCNVRELLTEMGGGRGLLAPRCTLTPETLFCEGLIPEAVGERLSAVVVSPDAIARLATAPATLPAAQPQAGRTGLALVVPAWARRRGTTIVVFGENGLICRTLGPVRRRLPNAHAWIARFGAQKPQHRRYVMDSLARGGGGDPAAAALLRELRALATDADRNAAAQAGDLQVRAELIIGCRTGVFASGTLIDPHRLAARIEIERLGVVRAQDTAHLARFRAGTLTAGATAAGATAAHATADRAGFAVFFGEADEAAAQAPVRLSLGMGSGNRIEFGEGPSLSTPEQACEAVLAALPPEGPDAALLACVEPVVRALLDERLASPGEPDVKDLGALASRPLFSVLLPFAAEPELLRCRAALLAADPDSARTELLYLVDRPGDRVAAERLVAELQAGYGLAARLVLSQRRLPPGAMFNAALRACRGEFVAVLGRTAVPEAPGWLGTLAGFLKGRPQRGVVAAQILHPDQSLLCAGAEIGCDRDGRWALRPRLAGFPRDYAPAAMAGRVDAVAPDCLLLSRALLTAVDGFGEDYLLDASVVADLCLKAAARGLEIWRLPEPAAFRFGGCGDDEAAASAVTRRELDRRLLEQRWRQVQPVASRRIAGDAPQPIRARSGPADIATQEAA